MIYIAFVVLVALLFALFSRLYAYETALLSLPAVIVVGLTVLLNIWTTSRARRAVNTTESLIENYDVSGSIVYVARVRSRNTVAIAKPCKSCLKLLIEAGVKRIVWTEDEHHAGIMGLG